MNRLGYLMDRYATMDIEVLRCRVPFNFEDEKYESMSDKEYIEMIDEIEKSEDEAIYEILVSRGII